MPRKRAGGRQGTGPGGERDGRGMVSRGLCLPLTWASVGKTGHVTASLVVSSRQPVPAVPPARCCDPSRLLSQPPWLPSGHAGPRAGGERCLGWHRRCAGGRGLAAGTVTRWPAAAALSGGRERPSHHLAAAARSGGVESTCFIIFLKKHPRASLLISIAACVSCLSFSVKTGQGPTRRACLVLGPPQALPVPAVLAGVQPWQVHCLLPAGCLANCLSARRARARHPVTGRSAAMCWSARETAAQSAPRETVPEPGSYGLSCVPKTDVGGLTPSTSKCEKCDRIWR